MADVVERLRRAVMSGEDGCGTLPAKESVKVRPADWHSITRLAREAATEIETLRGRLSQAGAGGGVVVRPLEWGHIRATAVCSERHDAVGADVTYSIYLRDSGIIQWGKGHTTPVFTVTSIDEAKASAQADYEARILAALAPSPSAGEPITSNCCHCGRVVDTREKADGGDDFGCQLTDGRWTCSPECWDAATEATPPATPVQPTASVEAVRKAPADFSAGAFRDRGPAATTPAPTQVDDQNNRPGTPAAMAPTQGDGA